MSHYPHARFLTSAHLPSQFVPDTGTEVAFAGRSNAGKSSAINALLNRRNFAKTSKTPGRTQLINFFELNEGQRLVDLPGYGYARVAASKQEHWRELMQEYFATRASLAGIFVMVDIRRELTDFDWMMVDWGMQIGSPVHILLTKADKLKRGPAKSTLLGIRRELGDQATVQLFSALKKDGVEEGRKVLDGMLDAAPAGEVPAIPDV